MNEPARVIVPDRVEPRERAVVPMPANSLATPMQMLGEAVRQGADIDKLEKLMALSREWEANEARKSFVEALAAFKAEAITITKDKHVNYPNSKGGSTDYWHATIGNIISIVAPALSRHGLSHRWKTEQLEGGMIRVTCILTHRQGHSEETSLSSSRDDSGGKNNIQAVGSTVSYLQRYTLLALTGLATRDQEDDDGRGPPPKKTTAPDGFDKWFDDMEAVAEEGTARLMEVWKQSSLPFRSYATKFEGARWAAIKSKAGKVQA